MNSITFSRQQLYDLVWSIPLGAIAKKNNISIPDIRRACKLLDVPIPEIGHWSKLKHGKKVVAKPLSDGYEGKQEFAFPLLVDETGKKVPQLLTKEKLELQALVELTLKKSMIYPDPLLVKAKQQFDTGIYYRNELFHTGWNTLKIKVSKKLVGRALRIMDTFVKVMRQRGHSFKITDTESYLIIDDVEIAMHLKEVEKTVVRKEGNLTYSEVKAKGILSLRFDTPPLIAFRDGKSLLEQQLTKIILHVEEFAAEKSRKWAEQAIRQKEYDNKRLIEHTQAEKKRLELANVQTLLKDALRWKAAQELRDYINHAEQAAIGTNSLTEDTINWLEWARAKADWFDPFIKRVDELLVEVDPNSILANKGSSVGLLSPFKLS